MTAHSLPRRVAEQEPDYLAQLRATADAVAAAAGLAADRWTFCWQSAGHEPGEWMKPDFADLMPGHRRAPRPSSVLVAPVQFLADHLEILYDVDVGAREQAEASRRRVPPDRLVECRSGPDRCPRGCGDRDDASGRGVRQGRCPAGLRRAPPNGRTRVNRGARRELTAGRPCFPLDDRSASSVRRSATRSPPAR